MPFFLMLITLAMAGLIAFQDFRARRVSVWVLLAFSFIALIETFLFQSALEALKALFLNLCFLSIQVLLLAAYYYLRYKDLRKLSASIGGADIWLICALAASFSSVNFILFITVALMLSLTFYVGYLVFFNRRIKEIPLAGSIALFYGAGRLLAYFYDPMAAWNDDLLLNVLG